MRDEEKERKERAEKVVTTVLTLEKDQIEKLVNTALTTDKPLLVEVTEPAPTNARRYFYYGFFTCAIFLNTLWLIAWYSVKMP